MLQPTLRVPGLKLCLGSAFVCALTVMIPAAPAGAQTCSNSTATGGSISLSNSLSSQSASSCLTFSGATGTIKTIQVTLNNVNSDGSSSSENSVYFTSFILTSPGGRNFVLLGSTGDSIDGDDAQDAGSGLSNAKIIIADGSPSAPGGNSGSPWPQSGGLYGPSSYWKINHSNIVPSPMNGYELPLNDGTVTLDDTTNGFGGGSANGAWTLTVRNDPQNGFTGTAVSVGSWTLSFTYNSSVSKTSTTTTLSSSSNPVNLTGSVALTATVTPVGGSGTSSTGTVAFADATNSNANLCSPVAVSNNQATCTVLGSTLGQGLSAITATYSGDSNYFSSTSPTLEQLVEVTASQSGDTWCNSQPISIANSTTPQAYPSVIHTSGYANGTTVSDVSVQLKSINWLGEPAQHLLVSPDGSHNLDFLDDGWSSQANPFTSFNMLFEDGGSIIPINGTPSGGTYSPFSNDTNFPSWPALPTGTHNVDNSIPSVPGTINFPSPVGSSTNTFLNKFNGATANGDWALYVYVNGWPSENIAGGWCITLTPNTGTPTTTTVTSSANPATQGNALTLTATVKESSGNPVVNGQVTFLDNNTAPAGTVSGNNVVTVDASGKATFTTSLLTEGDHQITATYSGNGTDNLSTANFTQRVDHKTAGPTANNLIYSGAYEFCNAGPIGISGTGAATPNPSIINVSGLPGSVKNMAVTLKSLTVAQSTQQTETLVQGPKQTGGTTPALDFFSSTVGSGTVNTGDYVLSDSGSSIVGNSGATLSPGTYKPTSYSDVNGSDRFTSSIFDASPANQLAYPWYEAPTSFSEATPQGGSAGTAPTFTSTFGGATPNGNWGLFFNQAGAEETISVASGWCLDITTNPVTASVTAAHSGASGAGSDFNQGETGASITVSVTNNGTGSTADPSGSNPLTVVDTLDSAFTYVGSSGTGWSTCTHVGQTVTCTNDSSVAQGSSYPTLTLNVNVSNTAGSSIGNTASVSGAGITSTSGSDTIPVNPAPTLAVSVGHTGTFTQGSTAEWDVTVSNSATGSVTSGTINVTDSLPTGYTVHGASSVGNVWSCGSSANVVTCSSVTAISGGSSSTIALIVNVPATSPVSVSNSASAYGGGDPSHSTSGTAVTSTADSITVTQVPATVTLNTGDSQSAVIGTTFATALTATVKDAGGVVIASYSPVTFSAATGTNGQTGKFSGSSMATTATDANGHVSETITAGTKVGTYSVTVTAGTAQNSYTLTNTTGLPAGIAVSSGDGQSAADTTAFSNPLVALVLDAGNNPVPGATVTFTAPASGASGTFSNSTTTISTTTDANGLASATFTANQTLGNYQVSATVGAFTTNFSETNIVGAYSQLIVSVPPPVYATVPAQFTVSAEDAGGNVVTTATPTVHFTSTDSNAVLPADSVLSSGTASLAATFSAAGTWTITAADSTDAITGTSSDISVAAIPILVVNATTDNPGGCTQQTTPGINTVDASCTLREALHEAAILGAANISFAATKFASATSINAAGTLNIPANTNIQGPTSGSGAALTNLLTVNGGGPSTNYPVFTVGVGVNASIAHLIISQGNSTSDGGGIQNAGTLAITGSTISGNTASFGGGISNQAPGVLNLTNSTVSSNTANDNGGGIYNQGTVTASYSTIAGNTATSLGGGIGSSNSVTLKDSTVSGNSSLIAGGIAEISGTFSLANNVVAGNSAPNSPDGNGTFTTGGHNLVGDGTGITGLSDGSNGDQVGSTASPNLPKLAALGSYGGPTQTMIPLPGSPAICSAAVANIPSGITMDQRGLPNTNTTYSAGTTCVDAGAVQTNYAISFTTQPTPISPASLIQVKHSFQAAVTVTENGSPASPSILVPLTLTGSGTLSGGSASTSAGVASYSSLAIDAPGTGDKLTATLTLNGGLAISADSSKFDVYGLPFGSAEPVTDATTGSTIVALAHNFVVQGTAVDPHDGSPVTQVQIRIDGTAVGTATLGLPSPILEAAYNNPAYANGRWTFTGSASGLSLGTHTLTVVATDSLNLSRTIASENFTVAASSSGPPIGSADPVMDATTGSTIVALAHNFVVQGAAADPHDGTPVAQVQIQIDGTAVGTATLGLPSPFLEAAYNNPAYANGRWTFTGSASGLSLGTHTLTVIATDSLSLSTTIASESFTVAASSSGPPIGSAEPVTDATTGSTIVALAHNFVVQGAAADPHDGTPVAQVQIRIDGTAVGTATLGLPSPFLEAAYNNPAYANGHWTFTGSASGLSLGTHTLTVVATDSLSLSTTIASESFTVAASSSGPPIGSAEPVTDATTGSTIVALAHNFVVQGAAADPHDGTPVAQVQIQIDGTAVGTATLGLPSPILEAAYNNPAYANGHWTFTGSASGLSLGTHTLTVVATDSLSLSTTIASESFTVAASSSGPPIGSADPVMDATTGSTIVALAHNFVVQGAAADPHDGTPVAQVQIQIDGTAVGTATLGLPSPFLEAAYNNPAYANGRWTFTGSASGLSLGTHTLTVVATDSLSLSTTIASESFTVAP